MTYPFFSDLLCSSFVLDAFKRSYSNEDTATAAIPFFWDNFDKEGWSLWKCTYKYPEELKLVFMTSNLVSGMFQRLEKLRKYAFASMLILGENNNNQIEGIWVLRGQELAFDVSVPPSPSPSLPPSLTLSLPSSLPHSLSHYLPSM